MTQAGSSDGTLAPVDLQIEADLEILSERARRYAAWIADACRPYLGSDVFEVGSGIGTITQLLAEGRRLTAIERSPYCVERLNQRFRGRSDIQIVQADIADVRESRRYDSVVMINTLEHIADDVAILRLIRPILRPGGRLVLWVPAMPGLFAEADRQVGHHRRYERQTMRSVLADARFNAIEMRYVNAIGVPTWWTFCRVLAQNPGQGWVVGAWDRLIVPLARRIEANHPPPFGLSLFTVAVPS